MSTTKDWDWAFRTASIVVALFVIGLSCAGVDAWIKGVFSVIGP